MIFWERVTTTLYTVFIPAFHNPEHFTPLSCCIKMRPVKQAFTVPKTTEARNTYWLGCNCHSCLKVYVLQYVSRFPTTGIVNSASVVGVEGQQDMGATQVGTRLHPVTLEQVTRGQAVTTETAAAIRSPGPRALGPRQDAPTSRPTCVGGEKYALLDDIGTYALLDGRCETVLRIRQQCYSTCAECVVRTPD